MKVYETNQIRNIAILGHLGSGKTSIAESLLFSSGAIASRGSIEQKEHRFRLHGRRKNETRQFINQFDSS